MRHFPQSPSLDAHVQATWQTQLAAAGTVPGLLPELVRHRHELLSRFAVYYTQLRALPRRVRRALQRQWRLSLTGIALMLALGQQPVQAVTILVGGSCTLVDAITAANTDTATGGYLSGSGADTIVLPAGSTQTLTEVNNSTYGPTGLPVITSTITLAGNGSTIVRDSTAPDFRILAVNSTGELTLQETTVSGGVAASEGGIGGGVFNDGGTLTVLNSTISGNTSEVRGGGVASSGALPEPIGSLTLVRTLVSGNTASIAPEIHNSIPFGTVVADNHSLFGADGNAGVVGFSPGPTDVVPPAGIQLPDILDRTLAFHGGPTQTHALVPGSPAIDAGGPVCSDATGDLLLTDQRGKPRVVDGDADSTAACDIGAFEFFSIVNDFVTLEPALDTAFDPTPVPGGPAGTFTITATFTNTSATPLRFPFFTVTELSGGNLLLNAEERAMRVGATVTPEIGDELFSPGETVAVDFLIGLHTPERFTFLVDLLGESVP